MKKLKVARELIYECNVKRQFVDPLTKAREWRWVTKPVLDTIGNPDVKVRCKDCHGAVSLHGKMFRTVRRRTPSIAIGRTPKLSCRYVL